jgi:predicted nucleic acid-binding Zn ribbon protein
MRLAKSGPDGVPARRCKSVPGDGRDKHQKRKVTMLWTIVLVLLLLWLLGMFAYPMGGLIHLILVVALVVVVIRLIQGRRAPG